MRVSVTKAYPQIWQPIKHNKNRKSIRQETLQVRKRKEKKRKN